MADDSFRMVREDYNPLSICPANGLLAVFWDDQAEDWYTGPLLFIAVANITDIYQRPSGGPTRKQKTEMADIIGYALDQDGTFYVVNEMSNFCGFAMPGDEVRGMTSHLGGEARSRAYEKAKEIKNGQADKPRRDAASEATTA